MRALLFPFLLCVGLGCAAPAQPGAVAGPSPIPVSPAGELGGRAEPAPELAPETAEPVPEPSPIEVPPFAEVDVDPEDLYPLRGVLRAAGAVYETRDGPPLGDGGGRKFVLKTIVLDADSDGTPRRPRLLCAHRDHRIAVHVDAIDMTPVALDGAFVVQTRAVPKSPDPTTPGVWLGAGAEVELEEVEAAKGVARVRYRDHALRVEGWVAADRSRCGPAALRCPRAPGDEVPAAARSRLQAVCSPSRVPRCYGSAVISSVRRMKSRSCRRCSGSRSRPPR